MAEIGTTSSLTARYLRGINLIAREQDGANQYYLFNAHGDVTQRADAWGNVLKAYRYDAFGNEQNPEKLDSNPFRYCGEYFDWETREIYLRARYYNPAIGRFLREDTHWNPSNMVYGDSPSKMAHAILMPSISSIQQSTNLYVYCMNNPLLFIDATGWYAREAAITYAKEWAYAGYLWGRNPQYYNYRTDCANFVSQSLFAGEIVMNDSWHSYRIEKSWLIPPAWNNNRYDWHVAPTWRLAADQYNYFSNPENGFINGDVIVINDASEIAKYAKNGGIQAGDLMYFADSGATNPHHATMISKVDGKEIYFTGHTKGRFDRELSLSMSGQKVYIVRIRDDA